MKIRKKIQEIELQGSTKQVEWATSIRDKKALEVEKLGYSGVLKIMRPYVSNEILEKIGCDGKKSILTIAYWVARRMFSVTTCFHWIADRNVKTEDQLEEIAKTAIKEWSENSPFKK